MKKLIPDMTDDFLYALVSKNLETIKNSSSRLRNFFGILNKVEPYEMAVFGGAIRDWCLGKKDPEDIDIVINCSHDIIQKLANNFEHTRSVFNGYKFNIDGINFDVWRLQDSWGIAQKGVMATWPNLIESVPLDIQGILVFNGGQVLDSGFINAITSHQIELKNIVIKSEQGIISKCLRLQDEYGFTFGPKLRELIRVSWKKTDSSINPFGEICQKSNGSSN